MVLRSRVVDWSLAACVWTLFATGVLALYTGRAGDAWVIIAHGALGFGLAVLMVPKLRRVWRRVASPVLWDSETGGGIAALLVVAVALVSGWIWSSGGDPLIAGYNLLSWHMVFGTLVVVVVLIHAIMRRKPLRVRDITPSSNAGRRQFLVLAGGALGSFALWQVQRPIDALVGLRGGRRRFTGSFETGSFGGNDAFPPTSWVADAPRPIAGPDYRLRVHGKVGRELSLEAGDLDAGDSVHALLDCTSGWYTRQEWRGTRLDHLLARAGVEESASHVRIESHTGYRWTFPMAAAEHLLVATHVGGEPLAHGHGAPARLVAPGQRGFKWIKWVVAIEATNDPDLAAPASTVWSSGTAAGRGD